MDSAFRGRALGLVGLAASLVACSAAGEAREEVAATSQAVSPAGTVIAAPSLAPVWVLRPRKGECTAEVKVPELADESVWRVSELFPRLDDTQPFCAYAWSGNGMPSLKARAALERIAMRMAIGGPGTYDEPYVVSPYKGPPAKRLAVSRRVPAEASLANPAPSVRANGCDVCIARSANELYVVLPKPDPPGLILWANDVAWSVDHQADQAFVLKVPADAPADPYFYFTWTVPPTP